MKRFIASLALLVSSALFTPNTTNAQAPSLIFKFNAMPKTISKESKEVLPTPKDYYKHIRDTITYRYDTDAHGGNFWQTPAETAKRRTGDCEDMAYLLHDSLKKAGFKSRVVLGRIADVVRENEDGSRTVTYSRREDGTLIYHMWVEMKRKDGKTLILDPACKTYGTKEKILKRKKDKWQYLEIEHDRQGIRKDIESFIEKYSKDPTSKETKFIHMSFIKTQNLLKDKDYFKGEMYKRTFHPIK